MKNTVIEMMNAEINSRSKLILAIAGIIPFDPEGAEPVLIELNLFLDAEENLLRCLQKDTLNEREILRNLSQHNYAWINLHDSIVIATDKYRDSHEAIMLYHSLFELSDNRSRTECGVLDFVQTL